MGVRKNVAARLKLRGPPSFVREPDGSNIAERSVAKTRSCRMKA
jgi:hypothetical protein